MKAVAYIRISSAEQDSKRQHEGIKIFAKSKKLKLVKIFEDTISGTNSKAKEREGFKAMDEYLSANMDVKNILVLEVSRLGRKQIDILNTIEDYFLRGVNIHIDDLNLSTIDHKGEKSPLANMVISLLGSMAENETRLLSERIKSGKMQRARDGFAFSAKTTGYKKDKNGKPIIDEQEAPIVKRIFELAAKSIGMRSISEVIKDEFNRDFQMGTIGGILRNTFYKGERKYNNLNIKVEPIVSKELWKKANDSVDSRKHFASRRYVHPNIVQGKIYCGVCKNVMHQVVIIKARSNAYRCKSKSCSNSINRPWMQEAIKQVVEVYAAKTKDKVVRQQIKDEIKVIKSKLNNIKKELGIKSSARSQLTILFASGKIKQVDYDNSLKILLNDINKLETEQKHLIKHKTNYEASLNNKIEHYSQDLNILKKQIKKILQSVIILKDEVEINLSFASITLPKPSPGKLGWLTRNKKQNSDNQYGNVINNAHLITDKELEQIEINIHSMDVTDETLENYFKSKEYETKTKNVKSLGS